MSKLMEYQEYSAQLERDSEVGQQFGAVLRAARSGWVGPGGGLRTPSAMGLGVHEDAHAQLAALQKRLARLTSHVDNTLNSHFYRGGAGSGGVVATPMALSEISSVAKDKKVLPVRTPVDEGEKKLAEAMQENTRLQRELLELKAENRQLQSDKKAELEEIKTQLVKTMQATSKVAEGNEKQIECITQSDNTHKMLAEELKNELCLVRSTRQRIESTIAADLRKELSQAQRRNTALEKECRELESRMRKQSSESNEENAKLRKKLHAAQDTVRTLTAELEKIRAAAAASPRAPTPTRVVTTMQTTEVRRTPTLPKKRRKRSLVLSTSPRVPVEFHHMTHEREPSATEAGTAPTPPAMVDQTTSPISLFANNAVVRGSEEEVKRAIEEASSKAAGAAKAAARSQFDVVKCSPQGNKERVVAIMGGGGGVASSPVADDDAVLSPASQKLQEARRVAAERRIKERGQHSPSTPREDDLESAWFNLNNTRCRTPVQGPRSPSLPKEVIDVLAAPEFPHVSDTDDSTKTPSPVPPPRMPDQESRAAFQEDASKMLEAMKKRLEDEEKEAEERRKARLAKEEEEVARWRKKREEEERVAAAAMQKRKEEEQKRKEEKQKRKEEEQKRKEEEQKRREEERNAAAEMQKRREEEARAAEEVLLRQREELKKISSELESRKVDLEDVKHSKEKFLAELKEELLKDGRQQHQHEIHEIVKEPEPLTENDTEDVALPETPEAVAEFSDVGGSATGEATDDHHGPTLVKTESQGGSVLDGGEDTPSEAPSTPLQSPDPNKQDAEGSDKGRSVSGDGLSATAKSVDLFSTLGVKLPSPASSAHKELSKPSKDVLESVLAKRSPRGRPPASPNLGRGSPLSSESPRSQRPPSIGRGRGRGVVIRSPSVPSTPRSAAHITATVLSDTSTTPRVSPTRLPPSLQMKQLLAKPSAKGPPQPRAKGRASPLPKRPL